MNKPETPTKRMKRLREEVSSFIEGQLVQEFTGGSLGVTVARSGSSIIVRFDNPSGGPDYIEIIVKGKI